MNAPALAPRQAPGRAAPTRAAPTPRRSDAAADPEAVRARLGEGGALDPGVRSRMEFAFGRSFAGVRVHTGGEASRVCSSLSARAFAVGEEVGFAPGEYRPGTLEGDAMIAHELAHVAQQEGAPGGAMARGVVPARSPLEADADLSAARAAAGAARAGEARPALRAGGLALQRCNDAPPRPRFRSGFGEFDLHDYTPHDSSKDNDTIKKQVGCDVEIEFTPDMAVLSDKITFVQVIRMAKGGAPYYLSPHMRDRATTAAQGAEGHTLDRVDGVSSPSYNETNAGTEGTNTRFGRRTPFGVRSAWMRDRPRLNRAMGQTVTFAAASFALDNTQGRYLGAVSWGFECDAVGKVTLLPAALHASGDPGGVEKAALQNWNTQANDPDPANRNDPNQQQVPVPP